MKIKKTVFRWHSKIPEGLLKGKFLEKKLSNNIKRKTRDSSACYAAKQRLLTTATSQTTSQPNEDQRQTRSKSPGAKRTLSSNNIITSEKQKELI